MVRTPVIFVAVPASMLPPLCRRHSCFPVSRIHPGLHHTAGVCADQLNGGCRCRLGTCHTSRSLQHIPVNWFCHKCRRWRRRKGNRTRISCTTAALHGITLPTRFANGSAKFHNNFCCSSVAQALNTNRTTLQVYIRERNQTALALTTERCRRNDFTSRKSVRWLRPPLRTNARW